jgi:hypothetical protein
VTAALRLALLASLLGWAAARADAAGPADAGADAAEGESRGEASWSLSPSIYGFVVPDARDYLNPNLAADRGPLHLEARWNYEAFEAGSAWIGWNLAFGEELAVEVTPMVGGVFGSVDGVAPGWLLSVGYGPFSLSSQGEYLIDASGSEGNFLYTWGELDWSRDWFRTGLAVQRTKAYETELEVQRGLLVGASYRSVELAGYVFDLGWTDPTLVLAVTASF